VGAIDDGIVGRRQGVRSQAMVSPYRSWQLDEVHLKLQPNKRCISKAMPHAIANLYILLWLRLIVTFFHSLVETT